MRMESCKRLKSMSAYFGKDHFIIAYFPEIMGFISGAYRNEIIAARIIMEFSSDIFAVEQAFARRR